MATESISSKPEPVADAQAHQHIELPPLTGSARMWGTLALSAATFMNVLDTSIANVSLPAIAGDLGVSPNQGTWVITSFGVANAISVPLTGWLSQRFGQVRLFMISVILFVISSWLCGLAPNMTTLIIFRIMQGLAAGPLIPLSQTLLLSSYPKALAGLAMALWSMTTLVAPVLGPLLGGWITDNISWPWIFYINIPVGFGAAFMIWKIYHKRESQIRKLPIDSVGLALLVLWIGALQIMLDKGQELDWFHSGEALVFSPIVGKNIGKVDPRRMATFAFLTFALVLWMRSHFNTQADFWTIMIPTIIQGVAMAFFFIPLVTLTLSGISPDKIPAASGLSNFARITAGSFGTSIATTVWQDRAAMHHAHIADTVNTGSQAANSAIAGLGSAGLSPDQALGTINRLVDQQAYMLAASDVFYVSALIFLALIPLVYLARPAKPGAGGASSADAAAGAH